jgi:hypothetical protein
MSLKLLSINPPSPPLSPLRTASTFHSALDLAFECRINRHPIFRVPHPTPHNLSPARSDRAFSARETKQNNPCPFFPMQGTGHGKLDTGTQNIIPALDRTVSHPIKVDEVSPVPTWAHHRPFQQLPYQYHPRRIPVPSVPCNLPLKAQGTPS